MSSCSSVVDLVEAADHDDAISKLFFSDGSSAGAALIWPAESAIESTLARQDFLVALCQKHGVPSELAPVCADSLGWKACTPPPVGSNKMCVYAAALDAGLRFPLHRFYARILRHYRLAPSQLTPNSWTYLAAFVLLCQDAGVEPLVSAFRYFFTICAHRHGRKPTGWHHFQPYHDGSRRLFAGNLPSRSGWKSKFFFLECPSGWKWNCPVKWGRPRRADARRVQLTDTVIQKLDQKRCVDVKAFLANREMPVGEAILAPLLVKAEAGAAGPGAVAAAVGAAAENASTPDQKRSRLSPAAVLSQSSQPLPTSAPPGFAPIRASSTGGRGGHVPPPGLPPFRASSTGGSSEVTPPAPQTMCASDALQLWEARAKASDQAAMIAKLNQELELVKTWNTQWEKELRDARAKHATEITELAAHLRAANDRNKHLNEVLVRFDKEYAAERDQLFAHLRTAFVEVEQLKAASVEVAQLKAEHAAESAQLKKELEAEAERLKEELAEDAEQLKHEGYTMGASDMRDLTLAMFKDLISPDELKVEMLLDNDHQIDLIRSASPLAVEDQ